MKTSLTKKIIVDFFDGKGTSIQQKMIAEWLQSPENEELFYEYLDEWESQHPQTEIDVSEALENVKGTFLSLIPEVNQEIRNYPIGSAKRFIFWLSAASIVLVFGWFASIKLMDKSVVTYDTLVQNSMSETGEIYEKENRTQDVLLMNLPDGSSILLQPNAKLSYSPNKFNKQTREVILSGDAFFEVKKDKSKPFVVYANNLITKVLGTSFTIKANPETSKTKVFVKTGKVAVFTRKDEGQFKKIETAKLEGFVLQPNQQITLNKGEMLHFKPLDIKVEELTLPIQTLSFSFEDTPVVEVLEQLKMAYNVPINYNKASLAKCNLTAHLSDEPLLEKVKLLCFALDATYEESDGEITIKSRGCN